MAATADAVQRARRHREPGIPDAGDRRRLVGTGTQTLIPLRPRAGMPRARSIS
jgi:hypothetical protein